MDSRDGAFIQKTRVIVNVHREQARSYRVAWFSSAAPA
jgi:hypothetical protein